MRTCLLGLIFITACYAPVLRSDIPCSTKRECPNGQSCSADGFCVFPGGLGPDGGAPDGGGLDGLSPDAPPGTIDTDRDGIPDTSDNCPGVPNNDQRNEDGDTLGDACDLCPHVANNATTDSDGDGIPDACDPNPIGTTHDTRWLYEDFHAGLPNAWNASNGWVPTNSDKDTIQVTSVDGVKTSEFLILPLTSAGRTFTNFTITTSFTIDSANGNTGPEVGISLFDESSMMDVSCSLWESVGNGANPGTNPHLGMYDQNSNHSLNNDKSVNFSWKPGVAYTLTMVHRGTSNTCTVAAPGVLPLSASMTSSVAPTNGADAELFAFGGITARVDWVFIAGTP